MSTLMLPTGTGSRFLDGFIIILLLYLESFPVLWKLSYLNSFISCIFTGVNHTKGRLSGLGAALQHEPSGIVLPEFFIIFLIWSRSTESEFMPQPIIGPSSGKAVFRWKAAVYFKTVQHNFKKYFFNHRDSHFINKMVGPVRLLKQNGDSMETERRTQLNILCFIKKRINPYYTGFFNGLQYRENLDIVINTERGIRDFREKQNRGTPYNLVLIEYELDGLHPARKIRELDKAVPVFFFPSPALAGEERKEDVRSMGCSILEEKFYYRDFEDVFYMYRLPEQNQE